MAARRGMQGTNERELVRVLVDCAGQEQTYNPFYADVATRLCSHHNRFKFTFQLTFWDAWKTLDEEHVWTALPCVTSLRAKAPL